jgi:hypothetical protein
MVGATFTVALSFYGCPFVLRLPFRFTVALARNRQILKNKSPIVGRATVKVAPTKKPKKQIAHCGEGNRKGCPYQKTKKTNRPLWEGQP